MGREPRVPGMRRALRNVLGRVERDVDDEVAFHLDSRVEELTSRGVPLEGARRIAEAEFGDVRASRRELAAVDRHRRRREALVRWLDAASLELRHAARSLARAPAFTVAAVLTLAIGIGSVVAMFAVVYGVLLRPLPFGHPERLVAASHDLPPLGLYHEPQTAATYFAYQQLARTIDGIGVYDEGEANVSQPGGTGEPEHMMTAEVTASLIPVLEVPPLVGRVFSDADDRPGAAPVVLIGESLWRTRFDSDPKVVGRTLDLDGVTYEIIGVMPSSFQMPRRETRLWVPLRFDPASPPQTAYSYVGIARLKPGVTVADAERDFTSVLRRLPELYPTFVAGLSTAQMIVQMHPRPTVAPLQTEMTGAIAPTLWTIAVAAALILLVACANVANLTLVKVDARQRELAIRAALGAGRARLLQLCFTEAALVTALAAALGFGAAALGVRLLVAANRAGIPRLSEVAIDARSALFAIGVALVVAAGCTLFPALRVGLGRGLAVRHSTRGGTANRAQQRVRGVLVAAQIASALVVVAGSGLLMRTFVRLTAVRPGFDATDVATFWVSAPAARYGSDSAVVHFYSQLASRVGALPGVTSVGLTSALPLEAHGINQNALYPEGDATYATKVPPLQHFITADAGYFAAMRMPLLAGRAFEAMGEQQYDETIISRSTAIAFWKDSTGAAALGKQFRPLPAGHLYTVIGVVGDVHDTTLAAAPSQVVYFPETLGPSGRRSKRTLALVVRHSGQTSIDAAVRRVAGGLDPTLPMFDARRMSDVLSAATAQLTFAISILGIAALVTLVLGSVGLYGVLAYVVTLRRRELGIRIALGATPGAVAAGVARYGMRLTAAGIIAGLGVFALVARYLRTLLFDVSPSDPLTLGAAVGVLATIAVAASWLPARRAARVDPASTLRAE